MLRAIAVVAVAAAAAAFAATPLDAGRESNALVRHGESIGKVRLGMTLPEVRKLLGRERAIVKRERRGTRGYVYLELEWDYAWWTVGFMRRPGGRYRTVRIATIDRSQRTREGVGPRSSEKGLYRRIPSVNCRNVFRTDLFIGGHTECVRGRSGARQTVFLMDAGDWRSGDTCGFVTTVEVRDPLFYRGWRVRFEPYHFTNSGSGPTGRC